MRGEIIGVWSETWREIWVKLAKHPEYGDDLFPDLYRELVPEPVAPDLPPEPEEFSEEGELVRPEDIQAREAYEAAFEIYTHQRAVYEEAVGAGPKSRMYFHDYFKREIRSEQNAVYVLERAHAVILIYGDEPYSNRFYLLVERFLTKFSLRYDLRRPFSLHTTLPGIFARLIKELKDVTDQDADLSVMMHEFEETVRDLTADQSSRRIKACIHKQMNLLEGLAQRHPNVTAQTLGGMCDQVGTWPHATLREAMKKLYGFSSDYPNIRHAGNPASALRDIEMKDMVAVSVMLAGFTPYLTDLIDADVIYGGLK